MRYQMMSVVFVLDYTKMICHLLVNCQLIDWVNYNNPRCGKWMREQCLELEDAQILM